MPNKEEVILQIKEWLDKSQYRDFMLSTLQVKSYLRLRLEGLKEKSAQEILEECE